MRGRGARARCAGAVRGRGVRARCAGAVCGRGVRARLCANFLYGFKAARRAARAAEHGVLAGIYPLALRLRTAPDAGRLARKPEIGAARGSTPDD